MQDKTPGISTIVITCSKTCPSVEPINEPLRASGRIFSMAEAAIVGAAIDAGLFNVEEVKAFCRKPWEEASPATNDCQTRSEHGDYVMAEADYGKRRAARDATEATLKQSPRGTWAMIREDWTGSDGRAGTTWTLAIADGRGGAYVTHANHIWHNEKRVPTYQDALDALVGYEIYLAQNAERERREAARSRLIIRKRGWAEGTKLRNVRVGGGRYSSALIDEISDQGGVRLILRKRGSRYTWTWTGLAQSIEGEGLSEELPAYGQLISTAA